MSLTPSIQCLENLGIPFKTYTHSGPISSLLQVAEERGQKISQIVRSILFRYDENKFVMVLINGPDQVSWPMLRQNLSTNRITLAVEPEVISVTGCRPGSVTPLGLSLPVIAHSGVFQETEISIGSGIRGTAIILLSKHLLEACPQIQIMPMT